MEEFAIHEEGVKKLLTRIRMMQAALFAFLLIIFNILFPIFPDGETDTSSAIVVGLVLLVAGVQMLHGSKKYKARLQSYKLTITPDTIIREVANTPAIAIPKHQVQRIDKNTDGSFVIIGNSKLNSIGVPAFMGRSDCMEQLLREIKPITIKNPPRPVVMLLMGFVVVAASFYAFSSEDIIISSLGGVAMSGIIFAGVIAAAFSKNIDRRTKRLAYIGLLPAFMILLSVIMRVFA